MALQCCGCRSCLADKRKTTMSWYSEDIARRIVELVRLSSTCTQRPLAKTLNIASEDLVVAHLERLETTGVLVCIRSDDPGVAVAVHCELPVSAQSMKGHGPCTPQAAPDDLVRWAAPASRNVLFLHRPPR